MSVHLYHWSQVVLSFRELIGYLPTHTVERGNEFDVNDDEKTDNYELNLARQAFSCSMRSICLLQYSCTRSISSLYKKVCDVSIVFMLLLGFPTWAQNGVTFATSLSFYFDESSFSH